MLDVEVMTEEDVGDEAFMVLVLPDEVAVSLIVDVPVLVVDDERVDGCDVRTAPGIDGCEVETVPAGVDAFDVREKDVVGLVVDVLIEVADTAAVVMLVCAELLVKLVGAAVVLELADAGVVLKLVDAAVLLELDGTGVVLEIEVMLGV